MVLLRTSSEDEFDPRALPNCFSSLNQHWFDSKFKQLDAAISEADLQKVVDETYKAVALLQSTIQSQLNYLTNFEILLTPPTDLNSVISWITSSISVFQQMYNSYAKLLGQVGLLEAQIAALTTEIERLANLNNWSINIPITDPFCQI